MTIGRTKAEAVVKDVLAPKAVGDVLKALTSDKPLLFSIQTDALNKSIEDVSPCCSILHSRMWGHQQNA